MQDDQMFSHFYLLINLSRTDFGFEPKLETNL